VARPAVDDYGVVSFSHVLLNRLVRVQLFAHLVKVKSLPTRTEPDFSALGLQFPQQQAQEGALARAVGTDDADPVSPHDGGGEVSDYGCAVIGKGDGLRFRHQPAGALRLLQLHPGHARALPPLAPFFPHLLQGPDPSLVAGASRLDPLPYPCLFPGQFLVEQRLSGNFRLQQGFAPFHEGIVPAGKGKEPPPVQFGNAVRHPSREGPVVGNEQEGLYFLEQEFFQPYDGSDVQVVGGLVQKKYVRRGDQGAGQEGPPSGASGKDGEIGVRVQGEAAEGTFHFLVQPPSARFFQYLVDLFQASQVLVAPFRCQAEPHVMVFGQQQGGFAHAPRHHVEH